MKNPAHNKIRDKQLCVAAITSSPRQGDRFRQLFKSKYGISKKKVVVEERLLPHRYGTEVLAWVVAPTVAQVQRGKKTHLNYKDFIIT